MKYLGGKFRTAESIAGYLNSVRVPGQAYWEPFVGATWVLRRINAPHRYASDINPYLINMWNAAINGWIPPENVSEEEYADIKNNIGDYKPELVAFVGFATSWGGKWFGGYARDPSSDRNYAREGSRSILRAVPRVKDVTFFVADFLEYDPPKDNMLIYCDPPYQDTTKYDFAPKFDHDKFWDRVRELSGKGHDLVVSEYQAPDDFTCVLEMSTKTDLSTADGSKDDRTERLFSLKPLEKRIKQLTMF